MHLLKFKYNTLKYFSKLVLYLIFILFHIYYSIDSIVGKMGIMIPINPRIPAAQPGQGAAPPRYWYIYLLLSVL